MDTTKIIAVLFDFDGVIMDTETQYTDRKSTRLNSSHSH